MWRETPCNSAFRPSTRSGCTVFIFVMAALSILRSLAGGIVCHPGENLYCCLLCFSFSHAVILHQHQPQGEVSIPPQKRMFATQKLFFPRRQMILIKKYQKIVSPTRLTVKGLVWDARHVDCVRVLFPKDIQGELVRLASKSRPHFKQGSTLKRSS